MLWPSLYKKQFGLHVESISDIFDTVQLIFIITVMEDFEFVKRLISMESIKYRTMGIGISDAVCHNLDA